MFCEGVWDQDTELNLHTKNRWHMAKVEMDFRTGKADIQQINRFLSALIIGKPTDKKVDFYRKNYTSGTRESTPITFKSMGILNNSWEVDVQQYDSKLRSDPAILLDEEKSLRAFQSGRDVTVYTDRRIVIIDVQGITGKRTKYKSIPYKYMLGFEFETAGEIKYSSFNTFSFYNIHISHKSLNNGQFFLCEGNLDRDAEVYQYSDICKIVSPGPPRTTKYLRTKQSILVKEVDIYGVAKLFTDNTIFSTDTVPEEEPEIALDWW